MTMHEELLSGCPFRKLDLAEFYCALSPWGIDTVTGFEMCAVDWESCPDYQKYLEENAAKAEK